jgi:hypothetical protein
VLDLLDQHTAQADCWPSGRLLAHTSLVINVLSMMGHCCTVTTSFAQMLQLQIGTSGTFDAEAYRQSLAANSVLQQQIKEKRHGSAAQEGKHWGSIPCLKL